jgi:hypothetical protein
VLLASYAVLGSEFTAKDKYGICDGQCGTTGSFVLRALGYSSAGPNLCFETMAPQNNFVGSAIYLEIIK